MKTLVSIQGHAIGEKLVLSLFVPAVAFWLPFWNTPDRAFLILGIGYCAAISIFLILSILPSKRILAAWDNSSISTPNGKVDFPDIQTSTLVDCGMLTGWELGFQTSNVNRGKKKIFLSTATNFDELTYDFFKNVSCVNVKRRLLGSLAEWLVGLEIAALAVGTLRLVLFAIA